MRQVHALPRAVVKARLRERKVPARLSLGPAAPLPATAQESQDAPATSGGLRAPRPPMGWNSWNSFATTLTEAQAIETARIMADKLLPWVYGAGWWMVTGWVAAHSS